LLPNRNLGRQARSASLHGGELPVAHRRLHRHPPAFFNYFKEVRVRTASFATGVGGALSGPGGPCMASPKSSFIAVLCPSSSPRKRRLSRGGVPCPFNQYYARLRRRFLVQRSHHHLEKSFSRANFKRCSPAYTWSHSIITRHRPPIHPQPQTPIWLPERATRE